MEQIEAVLPYPSEPWPVPGWPQSSGPAANCRTEPQVRAWWAAQAGSGSRSWAARPRPCPLLIRRCAYRELAAISVDRYRPVLAHSLGGLASALRDLRQEAKADAV
jgi:hypothetical protein